MRRCNQPASRGHGTSRLYLRIKIVAVIGRQQGTRVPCPLRCGLQIINVALHHLPRAREQECLSIPDCGNFCNLAYSAASKQLQNLKKILTGIFHFSCVEKTAGMCQSIYRHGQTSLGSLIMPQACPKPADTHRGDDFLPVSRLRVYQMPQL